MSEKLSLFDFGNDESGNYINLVEKEKQEWEQNHKEFPLEDLIKGNEFNNDFVIVAHYNLNFLSQWGYTLEQIRENIKGQVWTKCYHYGNMEKDIYVYSYKLCETSYRLCIQNNDYVVITKVNDINKVLISEETICYPACDIDIFKTENGKPAEWVNGGYGEYKNDIRYKVLCDMFKILEFSKNRIDQHKKVKDFYECEFRLEDFIKYWGEKNEVVDELND